MAEPVNAGQLFTFQKSVYISSQFKVEASIYVQDHFQLMIAGLLAPLNYRF